MTEFRNNHLSFSRLSLFEKCPQAFRWKYIGKHEPEATGSALPFGSAIHAVVELLLRVVLDHELVTPLPADRAIQLWQDRWRGEGLVGFELFQEGVQILKRFCADAGIVSHWDVLAVEQHFRLTVGRFEVVGFIDRADRVDHETVHIYDYKTNRKLFARDEVEHSLQLTLYAAAARKLWPWAKNIKLGYWMLRHGVVQRTERDDEQIDAAFAYVESLGEQTEAGEYPARLNTNCTYCGFKNRCEAYQRALVDGLPEAAADFEDLEQVAVEREDVSHRAKILYARKKELEGVLKSRLDTVDQLELGGMRYRMFHATSVRYPFAETVRRLAETTGLDDKELLLRLAAVDNKSLTKLLKELERELGKSRVGVLKAELDAIGEKTYTPRFWATEAR